MSEQDITLLRQQNALQQEIIRQLLSLNHLLKLKLRQAGIETDPTVPFDSLNEVPNDQKQSTDSSLQDNTGTNHMFDSMFTMSKGTMQPNDSSNNLQQNIKHLHYSNPYSATKTNELNDSLHNKHTGINEELYQLPTKIEASEGNVMSLANVLKASKAMQLPLTGRKKVARLLIHFHNAGGGSIKEMKAAAGYSASGMAKLMMNLRAKSIVIKHKVRDHRLSGYGLGLLHSARLK